MKEWASWDSGLASFSPGFSLLPVVTGPVDAVDVRKSTPPFSEKAWWWGNHWVLHRSSLVIPWWVGLLNFHSWMKKAYGARIRQKTFFWGDRKTKKETEKAFFSHSTWTNKACVSPKPDSRGESPHVKSQVVWNPWFPGVDPDAKGLATEEVGHSDQRGQPVFWGMVFTLAMVYGNQTLQSMDMLWVLLIYTPVIQHGLLENGPLKSVIFLARNLHIHSGFSS